MLVLLPPSEGKTRPADGPALDLAQIHPFSGALERARREVLENLIQTSAREDALEVLKVGKSIAGEVHANTQLIGAPTAPAWQVYSGVLFEAGNFLERGPLYSASDSFEVLVQSALFGAVDLASPIPAYRLSMDTKLPEIGALGTWWRKQLADLMNERAHHRLVVDMRSGAYQKAWPGTGLEVDLIRVNAVRDRGGKRSVVSHSAKRYRGILAGALIEHRDELDGSIDSVLEVARGIEAEDFTGVEVREARDYLELVIVTS
ncbi:MAG: peroxide stress protein YaaA [Actinomycetaceae bacterium]|nr:peroxide stress protein YaaA [Actinomycetaceae bacterium]